MKERPLIFSGPMVQAMLDGKKTQTRRIIKPQPHDDPSSSMPWVDDGPTPSGVGRCGHSLTTSECPYGQPGDRLWVRETWAENPGKMHHDDPKVVYKTDFDGFYSTLEPWGKWKPSIHMPRWASRITLEITNIRVERLQDISIADVLEEGLRCPDCGYTRIDAQRHADHAICINRWLQESKTKTVGEHAAVSAYRDLWDSIKRKHRCSWAENPWVWVIEFEVVKK